jgi:type III secretory pathway component EscU
MGSHYTAEPKGAEGAARWQQQLEQHRGWSQAVMFGTQLQQCMQHLHNVAMRQQPMMFALKQLLSGRAVSLLRRILVLRLCFVLMWLLPGVCARCLQVVSWAVHPELDLQVLH